MKQLILLFVLIQQFTYAQNVDLRKLTLNSDIILLVDKNDITYETKPVNDHFSENYITIKATQHIIKNNSKNKFINKKVYDPKNENDFFDDDKINSGPCLLVPKILEINRKYYSIVFLKKHKKQLTVLAKIHKTDYDWDEVTRKIYDVLELEKLKTNQEIYQKSIDYFLKHNELPDDNFIDYYKSVSILKSDSLLLTQQQTILVKEKFLNGFELFYDLVKNKFPKEVKSYYINKMKEISDTKNLEDISFYDFEEAYERATNTDYMDDSENGVLKESLTESEENNEKQKIMKILIEAAENSK